MTSRPRQGIEQPGDFVELVRWGTACRARIWCGWVVFSHNASKIAALAN